MYYGGMSLADISLNLKQEHGYAPSTSTVWDWVSRYTDKAVAHYDQYTPKVGDTWVVDETVINLDGKRDVWLWDIIDADTRFLLATKMSYTRTIEDAKTVLELAKDKAGKSPKIVLSDFHNSYPEAMRQVFGDTTFHEQSKPCYQN